MIFYKIPSRAEFCPYNAILKKHYIYNGKTRKNIKNNYIIYIAIGKPIVL